MRNSEELCFKALMVRLGSKHGVLAADSAVHG